MRSDSEIRVSASNFYEKSMGVDDNARTYKQVTEYQTMRMLSAGGPIMLRKGKVDRCVNEMTKPPMMTGGVMGI